MAITVPNITGALTKGAITVSGITQAASQLIHWFKLISNLSDSSTSDTMTMARSSAKKYTTDSGGVTTASANTAAFTGSGVLIEPSHTNIMLYSKDLSTGYTLIQSTRTTGITDPEGGSNAGRLTATGTTSYIYNTSPRTVTGAATYTISVIVKPNEVTQHIRLSVQNSGFTNGYIQYFQITGTPAVGTGNGFGANAWTATNKGVEVLSGGWVRCYYSFTVYSGDTTLAVTLYQTNADNATACDISDELDYYQLDVQAGAILFSMVETTTASATSLKDDLSMPCDQIPANDFYIEFDWTPLSAPVNGNYIMSLTSGTGGMEIYYSTGFIEWAFPTIGEGGAITGTPSAGTTYTIRIEKTSAGGVVFSMTGFTTDTDATATADITWPSTGTIGSRYTGGNHSHSVIANVKVGDA